MYLPYLLGVVVMRVEAFFDAFEPFVKPRLPLAGNEPLPEDGADARDQGDDDDFTQCNSPPYKSHKINTSIFCGLNHQ